MQPLATIGQPFARCLYMSAQIFISNLQCKFFTRAAVCWLTWLAKAIELRESVEGIRYQMKAQDATRIW